MGADVNARNKLDEPVLSLAIVHGDMKVAKFLLRAGTDIHHGNLLHCAAQRTNHVEGAELAEELAARGVDVNAYRYHNPVAFRWRAGFSLPTPLHVACEHYNFLVAQVLLQHGANPTLRRLAAGKTMPPTPLEKAQELGQRDMWDLLARYHTPRDSGQRAAACAICSTAVVSAAALAASKPCCM